MRATLSTRTICCKLAVDAAADATLCQTQAAFNAAASYCATVAWNERVTNKNKLGDHPARQCVQTDPIHTHQAIRARIVADAAVTSEGRTGLGDRLAGRGVLPLRGRADRSHGFSIKRGLGLTQSGISRQINDKFTADGSCGECYYHKESIPEREHLCKRRRPIADS